MTSWEQPLGLDGRVSDPPEIGRAELAPLVVLAVRMLSATYLAGMVFLALWVVVPSVVRDLQPVAITSGSMAPALGVGDVVLLGPVGDDLGIGEVVTFRDATGGLVTHRVVGIDDQGVLTTRGDANADPDARAVPPGDVVGTGVLAVPWAGLPAHWLGTAPARFGLWALVTIAAAVLVFRRGPPAVPAPQPPPSEAEQFDRGWPEPDDGAGT